MQPKKIIKGSQPDDLFRSRLEQILNLKHPLCVLAERINWLVFEGEFGALYHEHLSRPGLPIRLLVGLHYLKHAYDESDELVVEKFLENPYWQYFCGFEYFQHEFPLEPTSLVKWRHRVGSAGIEKLLQETVETAKGSGLLRKKHVERVNVDTTVQEKAISYPTDAKLYHRMRQKLVVAARERGLKLRQTYRRLSKRSLHWQNRSRHAGQTKRANKETKRLKNYPGRVTRNIWRLVPSANSGDERLSSLLSLAERLYRQERKDRHKVYSIHAPEVECLCKGKVHKRYEFGCKVSPVSTSRDNWVIGAQAHHNSPYDGHTLRASLSQAARLSGYSIGEAYCDRGY
jgi:IS5 family transposase